MVMRKETEHPTLSFLLKSLCEAKASQSQAYGSGAGPVGMGKGSLTVSTGVGIEPGVRVGVVTTVELGAAVCVVTAVWAD